MIDEETMRDLGVQMNASPLQHRDRFVLFSPKLLVNYYCPVSPLSEIKLK